MKKYILLLMLTLSAASSYAQSETSAKTNDTVFVANQQWEYMSLYIRNSHANAKQGKTNFNNHDKLFNDYGKQGWELVSVTPLVASNILNGRVYTSNMCYTFKRRKSIKQ